MRRSKVKNLIRLAMALVLPCNWMIAESPSHSEWNNEIAGFWEETKDQAAALYDDAKEKWEDFNHQRSLEEIRRLYERAKEAGEKVPADVYAWIRQDLQRVNNWEYHVAVYNPADSEAIAARMNELGAQRWECVGLSSRGDELVFVFKRRARSYLRHIPVRELLYLLPVGGEGDGG